MLRLLFFGKSADCFAAGRMDHFGRNFHRRKQNEVTPMHLGMRNDERRRFDDPVAEQQDIDIKRSWSPMFSTFASECSFDLLKNIKQFGRFQHGQDQADRVQEIRLSLRPADRLCFKEVADPKCLDIRRLTDCIPSGSERLSAVSKVGTESQQDLLHENNLRSCFTADRQSDGKIQAGTEADFYDSFLASVSCSDATTSRSREICQELQSDLA